MLVNQTLRGEILAFEELVNRYKNSVFSIVYRMTGQYQEAEDISQDVFLTVYQKLYQFDNKRKFSPWIHRIAINTCISSLRKKNKVVTLNFDESFSKQYEQDINYNYSYQDPELMFEKKELKEEIEAAIRELPDNYKMVIVLRYQMDYNNQEIADILNVTRENIEVRIHRARKALRKVIINNWEKRGLINELPANQ